MHSFSKNSIFPAVFIVKQTEHLLGFITVGK